MAGAITETIDVNAGPGIAGLKEFTDALQDAADKWAEFEAKLGSGLGGGGADKLAASMDEAAAAISAAADKAAASLDKIGAAGDAAGAGMERIGEAADAAGAGLERLDDAAATAGASLDEAAAGADTAAAASDRLAESADAAGAALDRQAVSGKEAGDSAAEGAAASEGGWKVAKVALLGLGVAAAYGIDKAMKFQSQMLLLNTQAGVSMPNVKKMSQGVLEISTTTGQSLSDVAESAYHVASNMASLGTSVPNMLKAVKVAAEGAAVGHSNMVDTTNALTATLAAGMPGVKTYSQAMGVLNSTVGAGDMTMQDLADAMGTGMLATVKGFGVSIQDVGAGLATFGDNNIRGAKAGNELRMAIQALGSPGTGAVALGALKQLGLQYTTLGTDMQKGGLKLAITDLVSHMQKAGDTGAKVGEILTDAFGKKAGAGINILTEQEDRFLSKYPAMVKGANDFNAAWERTQATPAQRWKELGAGLQASAVNFGTSLLPAFTAAAGFADRILGDINGTKGAADALAIAFGGVAALFTGKKLVSGIESAFQTGESVLRGIGKIFDIPGLSNLGKSTGLGGVSGSADAASASLDRLAESADRAAGSEGAAGAEGAGGPGTLAGLRTAAGYAGLGAIIGEAIKAVGDSIAPAGSTAGKYNAMLQKTPATNDSALMPSIFGGFEGKLMSSIGESVGKVINRALSFGGQLGGSAGHMAMGAVNYAGSAFAGVGKGAVTDFNAVKSAAQTAMSAVGSVVSSGMAKADAAISSGAAHAGAAAAAGFRTVVSAASSAMSAASSAVESGAGRIGAAAASIGGRITSALASLPGELASIGRAAVAGLASGIEAGIGAVVSAAEHVASAAEGAMKDVLKIFSPSKVTTDIGKDFSAGLAKGIKEGEDKAKASAVTLSASTLTSLTQGLQGGSSALTAALQAITGKGSQPQDITTIIGTISTLKDDVSKALAAGQISKPQDSALVKMLTADNTKLQALSNQRAVLEQEITDSQQIAQQAISNASIMNAGTYTPALAASNGPLAASATISGLQSMLADQQAFASQVGQLKSGGLNATSLNQIVQSGASSGLPVAEGLTSGGKSAIAQVNKLEAQLQSSAAKLGDEGAGPMYQAGVAAGQGLASGIKSQLGSVDAAIKQLADSMVSEIKKDLKSHSPSLVFAEVGMSIPQGVAMGVDLGTPVAQAAVGRMGSRLYGGHPGISYGHDGASAGGGGGNVTIHNVTTVTVQGSVTTENDLLTKLQAAQLRKANNNWQGGWQLPGRKT